MKIVRSHFEGVVEITSDKGDHLLAEVTLTGYVEMTEIPLLSGTLNTEGVTTWTGFINSKSNVSLALLIGKRLQLKFLDGRVARARIDNSGTGTILGFGPTPF